MLHLTNKPVTSGFQMKANSASMEEELNCVLHCFLLVAGHLNN